MFVIKNFFYAVAAAFLLGLQSVNPDKDLLRQFVLILQSDNFWTLVKLGTVVLSALEWGFSIPSSASSAFGDLKDLADSLRKVTMKFMPARFEAAGGPDLGPGFAKETDAASHFFQPPTLGVGRAQHTQKVDTLKTDQPFNDNERAAAKTLWNGSATVTIDDLSDLMLRTSGQCMRELVNMGLYPDLAAVAAENTHRHNLRACDR